VFAAGIFLVIGVNAMMLGICSKLLALRTGAQDEDGVIRFYRQRLGLERLLAAAVLMILAGAGLDVFVCVEWLGDSDRDLLPWAALASSLLVVGANLIFAALAAAMIDAEYE
jgi:hypothetical protein